MECRTPGYLPRCNICDNELELEKKEKNSVQNNSRKKQQQNRSEKNLPSAGIHKSS